MLGGGTFTAQNKILPGTYINFVSAASASPELSERGIATMPLVLDWGPDDEVFEVTPADFQAHARRLFGYDADAPELRGLRDFFLTGVRLLYAYKLTSGGTKASCTYGTAKWCGKRGNDLKIVIAANAETPAHYDVRAYLDGALVDEQMDVADASALVGCDYIDYDGEATLAVTAGVSLTGGANGTVNTTAYQAYLDAIEAYSYNVMGAAATDSAVKALLTAFCRRMRDERGAKFQCVLYDYASADYEGVISVMNKPTDTDAADGDLVYWVTGAEAACPINRTLLNAVYTGGYTVDTGYTQAQLETAMQSGKLAFHRVGSAIRVLADVNTLVTDAPTKQREIFGENQSVRVIDQIANDIASIFNTKYLGTIQNDQDGRISLWNDIVKHHQSLVDRQALRSFRPEDVTVTQGGAKNSVVVYDAVTLEAAMAKLYMTVTLM